MTRRWWLATIRIGLFAGLLPGCALLGQRRDHDAEEVLRPPVYVGPYLDPKEQPDLAGRCYLPDFEQPAQHHAEATPTSQHQADSAAEHSADEAQRAKPHPEPPPLDKPRVVYEAASPKAAPPKQEPLLEALACFLKNQPQKALELLKGYQPSNQEVFLSLLPVLAELTHKGMDQLTPEEVSVIHEQLESLADRLRPRAQLLIPHMCLCKHIEGYGVYVPLPPNHVFRAGSGAEPGEPVQLYVELRNFSMAPCPQGYVTRLSSSVEICDAAGKQQWFHSFKDQEGPLVRKAPWHDCFGGYYFYMPVLPPGEYTLVVTIRDLTQPQTPRLARKSVKLRVG
jgi:hypothetical protein